VVRLLHRRTRDRRWRLGSRADNVSLPEQSIKRGFVVFGGGHPAHPRGTTAIVYSDRVRPARGRLRKDVQSDQNRLYNNVFIVTRTLDNVYYERTYAFSPRRSR